MKSIQWDTVVKLSLALMAALLLATAMHPTLAGAFPSPPVTNEHVLRKVVYEVDGMVRYLGRLRGYPEVYKELVQAGWIETARYATTIITATGRKIITVHHYFWKVVPVITPIYPYFHLNERYLERRET